MECSAVTLVFTGTNRLRSSFLSSCVVLLNNSLRFTVNASHAWALYDHMCLCATYTYNGPKDTEAHVEVCECLDIDQISFFFWYRWLYIYKSWNTVIVIGFCFMTPEVATRHRVSKLITLSLMRNAVSLKRQFTQKWKMSSFTHHPLVSSAKHKIHFKECR